MCSKNVIIFNFSCCNLQSRMITNLKKYFQVIIHSFFFKEKCKDHNQNDAFLNCLILYVECKMMKRKVNLISFFK